MSDEFTVESISQWVLRKLGHPTITVELTKEQLQVIREECRRISFGKVIIEINEQEQKIDVITEKRVRICRKNNSTSNKVDKPVIMD